MDGFHYFGIGLLVLAAAYLAAPEFVAVAFSVLFLGSFVVVLVWRMLRP